MQASVKDPQWHGVLNYKGTVRMLDLPHCSRAYAVFEETQLKLRLIEYSQRKIVVGRQNKGDMMKIQNLTPHPITLQSPNGTQTIQPSGTVARVSATPGQSKDVEGIPVPVAQPDTFGAVEGLPDPEEGTFYIVSAMVGAHVKRADVLMPGTGPKDGAVRNEKGNIVAVTRLKATV